MVGREMFKIIYIHTYIHTKIHIFRYIIGREMFKIIYIHAYIHTYIHIYKKYIYADTLLEEKCSKLECDLAATRYDACT
jgi:hypothetical protein